MLDTAATPSPLVTTDARANALLWRDASRVLNRVPAYLTELPDGGVFFIVDLGEGDDTDDIVDALDPVTVQDNDGEPYVLVTDEECDDSIVLINDKFMGADRFMLVNLRSSYTYNDGGLAEVTVLPAMTTELSAVSLLKAIHIVEKADAEPDEEDDEVADRPEAAEQGNRYRTQKSDLGAKAVVALSTLAIAVVGIATVGRIHGWF